MKLSRFIITAMTVSLLFTLSCSKEDLDDILPVSKSIVVGTCTTTSFTASLNGSFEGVDKIDLALGQRGVLYCTDGAEKAFKAWVDGSDEPGCQVSNNATVTGESMQCTVNGLAENTEYSYCLFLQKKNGSREISRVSTFKTQPFVPEIKKFDVMGVECFVAFAEGKIKINDKDGAFCEAGFVISENNECNINNSIIFKQKGIFASDIKARMDGLESNKQYYCCIFIKYPASSGEYDYFYGPAKDLKTKNFDDVAVDLGLPSGALWASYNVGAEKPEEYGNYYAWGEIEPKSNYSWSTYKLQNSTKYSTDTLSSNYSSLKYIELADDAANYNWGGKWKMPSSEERAELRKYCSFYIDTINGVSGTTATSMINGNSIFIPFSGFRRETTSFGTGNMWVVFGNDLYFCQSKYGFWYWWYRRKQDNYDLSRWDGLTIRAVYPRD